MKTAHSILLSRRTLLHAALYSSCGTAALLAGCGGSSSDESNALPETYAEAYRLRLLDTEGVYDEAQIVGVTGEGDLLLTTRKLVYEPDGFQATRSAFRLSRYTNRAQPNLTRREDFLPTRTQSAGGPYGVTALSANGNVYVSRYLAENIPNEELLKPNKRNEVLIFGPDAEQTGSVTPKTTGGFGDVGEYFPYYTLSVSPSGDFYAPIVTQSSSTALFLGASEREISIIRWDRDGATAARYKSTSRFRFTENRVSFLPDGTAVTTGYDSDTKQYAVVRADGESGREVLLQQGSEGIDNLKTDSRGNFYCYMFNYETSDVNSSDPTPRFPMGYIRKFSPTGTLLAQIQPNRGIGTPFAVDGDGAIYMIEANSILMVYKRTR